MEFIRGIENLFLASGVPFPTCRCGAEKVATEICLSAEEEASEDTNSSLREISMEYSWSELSRATACFSGARILGRGRMGTVFDGTLEEGMEVAVKTIEEPHGRTLQEEVRLLSRCHHPNVVMLLGFSFDAYQGRHALVYELLPGGSVFTKLHFVGGQPFGWEHRLRTGIQISRAMAHLQRLRPQVFHRDLKSSAILFTAEGVAKLADFQMACTSKTRLQHFSSGISLGTPGYSSPEYVETGYATEASEVYAMGVVLVELLTGQMPTSPHPDGLSCASMIDSVRPEVERASDRLLSMLDPVAQWPQETGAGVAAFALQSLHLAPERRPSFLEMVAVLQHVSEIACPGFVASEAANSLKSPMVPARRTAEAAAASRAVSPGPRAKPSLVKLVACVESPGNVRVAEATGASAAVAACAASYAAAAAAAPTADAQPAAPPVALRPPPRECQQQPAATPSEATPPWSSEDMPDLVACREPQGAALGASAAGASETAPPEPKLDDRHSSDGEPAGVAPALASPPLASAAAGGLAELEALCEQPPAARAKTSPEPRPEQLQAPRAKTSPDLGTQRETEEGETAPLLKEPMVGAGQAAEPPKSWLQNLRRRSNPDAAASDEPQTNAEAAAPPLILTEELSALLSAGEPSPSQGSTPEVEGEVRGEGSARQWLRNWNWPRAGGPQGEGPGEATDAPPGRWDIRDKAEAAMVRWEIRDKAEAVMNRLDLRGKGDPENPSEPRRWLQSWIRPPTPSTQASGQDAANSKAEDDTCSGEEASSEDEGERRRWLHPWRRPQLSSAPAAPRRLAMPEAKGDAEPAQKPRQESAVAATACTAASEEPSGAQAEEVAAAEAPALEGPSPNHAAIGRLFHISDLVE